MYRCNRQRGVSLWTMLFILVVVGFLGIIGLNLFPIYLESFKVDKAMSGVVEEQGVENRSKREIAFSIIRRLDIDGSDLIKEETWKDFIKVTKQGGKVTVNVAWEKEAPVAGNLRLVAKFDKTASNRP